MELVNASQSDTYTVSGWAQADSMPKKSGYIAPNWRHYSIRVLVFYRDANGNSSNIVKHISEFNYFDSEKQFTSGSFNLKHPTDENLTPYKIRIMLAFYRQCNTALFDDIALYRSAEVYDLSGAAADTAEPTVSYEYYANGNIKTKTVTDSDNVTVYSYAESGHLTAKAFTETVTDENSNTSTVTTTYTYNADGNIATYTDEEGVLHTYTYNEYGDVISILTPDGTGDTFVYELYDTGKTRIKMETYDDGSVYEYTYHNTDIVATETVTTVNEDEETTVEVYNYDEHGNLISYTVDNALKESYTYTVIGGEYLVATEIADGYVTTYSYNLDGEITQKVKTLNGTEVEKDVYEYNSNGNYLSKHSHTENGATLTTHYNSDGAVTKVEHNGFAYNYSYDDFDNTTAVKVGNQSLISYSYLPDKSNLSKITYGNGYTEEYTYNAYGAVTKKTVSGLGDVEYRYDSAGRLTYDKDELSDRRTYHNYDLEGRLESRQTLDNTKSNAHQVFLFSSGNVYDDESRIIRKDMKGKKYALDTYYNYDENGMLSSVATTASGTRSLIYTYDEEDRVTARSMTLNSPYTNSYTYNDDGLIATDTVTAKNGTFAYNYTYDANGNITEITKNGTVQQRYVYDETDQLVREDNRDINKTVVYTYDGYGNILNKKEYAFTTGDLGAVTNTVSYTYDSTWKDKLSSYNGQSITYDSMGNPLSYRGATIDWNGRKLMSYTKDGTGISYEYDGNGLRTSKTVNGVKHDYYYDENNKLLYEITDGVYEIYYKYDADGKLFSVTRYRYSDGRKDVMYAEVNTRGDVIALRNYGGSIYCRYAYDSWGRCISVTDSDGNASSVNSVAVQNSIRYRGYVYDHETGLYYLQSRYYDPETGRFLNADSVDYIGYSGENISYNAFAYCENEPVCRVDVDGLLSYNCYKEQYRVEYRYRKYASYISYYYKPIKVKKNNFIIDGSINNFGSTWHMLVFVVKDNEVRITLAIHNSKGKYIDKNKALIRGFVKNDFCDELSDEVLEIYKAVYGVKFKKRTKIGIELEIILHFYMYYFDIDAPEYKSSQEINIDNTQRGNGLKIERIPSPDALILLAERAIKNNKENSLISYFLNEYLNPEKKEGGKK